ncbi:MAG: hypothetical protein ACK457_11955 [Flavobacteriia bacterium]
MKNRSFSKRLMHVIKQFSLYWVFASIACFIAVGPELIDSLTIKISNGIALIFLCMDQCVLLFSKIELPTDWFSVYPELGESCYSPGKKAERNARIFGNLSIALTIVAAYFLFLGNTQIALGIIFFASVLHIIFAVFNAFNFPPFKTNWSIVYPELSETDE